MDPSPEELQSIMRVVEHDCNSLKPGAEFRILNSLQNQPYKTCLYILKNSQLRHAKCQAAAALRDLAIKDWEILTYTQKIDPISICLDFLFEHSTSAEEFILRKMSSVAAQFLIRGWLEFQEAYKDTFLSKESWKKFSKAFENDQKLLSLAAPYQRSLAKTFVCFATGMITSEQSNHMPLWNRYVRDFTESCIVELKISAQRPDALVVCTMLERLRGAAKATELIALYEMGLSVIGLGSELLKFYEYEPAVVYVLLKFSVDWVGGQICFLEAKETAPVVKISFLLLEHYFPENIGKSSSSFFSGLSNTEKYKVLRALLQLLTNLRSKVVADTNCNYAEKTDIAQGVYSGFYKINQQVLELPKYPKLYHSYFKLISRVFEVYPEKVAHIDDACRASVLVDTLNFGLHYQDKDVVDMCLSALKALASYHYKEINMKRKGLGSQVGILSSFLQFLIPFLLSGKYSVELVSSAADALLQLILCNQVHFQNFLRGLINNQSLPELKLKLTIPVQTLTSSDNLSWALDGKNDQKFGKALYTFLLQVWEEGLCKV